jgi:hypothetical protein
VALSKSKKRDSASLETRVFVALLRAAERLRQDAEQLVKEYGLTGTQYAFFAARSLVACPARASAIA